MALKPYYTSRSLIDAVKRKIMFPINQATFTDDDVLSFCNEEMMISQVPAVMQYHEEYFVTYQNVPLQNNMSRYAVPKRAIVTGKDRKSTRLNSSHSAKSRMPSSA